MPQHQQRSEARKHFQQHAEKGVDDMLARTAGDDQLRLDAAKDVVEAVMEVVRREAADIKDHVDATYRERRQHKMSKEEYQHQYKQGVEVVHKMAGVPLKTWRLIFHPDRVTPVVVWDQCRSLSSTW